VEGAGREERAAVRDARGNRSGTVAQGGAKEGEGGSPPHRVLRSPPRKRIFIFIFLRFEKERERSVVFWNGFVWVLTGSHRGKIGESVGKRVGEMKRSRLLLGLGSRVSGLILIRPLDDYQFITFIAV
jgi:hypothetical protein